MDGSSSGGGGGGGGAAAINETLGQTFVLASTLALPALGTLALVGIFCPKIWAARRVRRRGADGGSGSSLTLGVPSQTFKTMSVLCLWGFLCTLSGGMIQSPFTELLLQRACERESIPFGTQACDHSSAAQTEATYRNTFMTIFSSIAGFVSLGVASVVADSYGRKYSLTAITIGSALYPAAIWLIPMSEISLLGHRFDGFWMILAITTVANLFGIGGFLSISMSVMADVSASLSHAGRTNMLMLLEAATWGGSMIGPILGAKLANLQGLRTVFGYGCVSCIIGLAVLLLGYDESLDPSQRIEFTWKRANPVGQLFPLIAHRTMVKFSIILGPTYLLAAIAYNLISQLYWIRVADANVMELASLLSLATAVGLFSLLVMLPLLQGWGVGRRTFILSALYLCIVQWLLTASMSLSLVKHLPKGLFSAIPYAVQVLGLLMGPFMPCIRSSIASLAESEMRGVASVAVSLGAIAALQTIVSFIAPLIASPVYAATEHRAPGTVFVLMAGLAAVAAAVAHTLPNLEAIDNHHSKSQEGKLASEQQPRQQAAGAGSEGALSEPLLPVGGGIQVDTRRSGQKAASAKIQ